MGRRGAHGGRPLLRPVDDRRRADGRLVTRATSVSQRETEVRAQDGLAPVVVDVTRVLNETRARVVPPRGSTTLVSPTPSSSFPQRSHSGSSGPDSGDTGSLCEDTPRPSPPRRRHQVGRRLFADVGRDPGRRCLGCRGIVSFCLFYLVPPTSGEPKVKEGSRYSLTVPGPRSTGTWN